MWNPDLFNDVDNIQRNINLNLIQKLDIKRTDIVLDAGCGNGRITFEVAKVLEDGFIYGIDSSQSMIDECNNKLNTQAINVKFKQGDLSNLDVENTFDIIYSNSVFHWVKVPYNAYLSLYNSLVIGGSMGIQLPLLNSNHPFIKVCNNVIKRLHIENYYEEWDFPWYVPNLNTLNHNLQDFAFEETEIHIKIITIDFKNEDMVFKSFDTAGLKLYTNHLEEGLKIEFRKEVKREIISLYQENNYKIDMEKIFVLGYKKLDIQC